MVAAILMAHVEDPSNSIYEGLPKGWDKIKVIGNDILVAHYVRPEKTKGGLFLTEKGTREEEKYQGKAVLILKKGPLAFAKDATHDWGDDIPEVGDWVAVWGSDASHALELGTLKCRVVEDVYVKLILPQPDIIM